MVACRPTVGLQVSVSAGGRAAAHEQCGGGVEWRRGGRERQRACGFDGNGSPVGGGVGCGAAAGLFPGGDWIRSEVGATLGLGFSCGLMG